MRERALMFLKDTFFVDVIDDNASFLQSGIIDSSGVLELVQFIEDEIGVRLSDDELIPENLDSVAAVVAFATRKRAAVAFVAA